MKPLTDNTLPQFDAYVCAGDSITWQAEGFDLTARLEYDTDSKPTDCDCYSAEDIRRWKADEWFYGGIVVSVSLNGVKLSEHASSLWGIYCNFGEDNSYLSEVAKELEGEAIAQAKVRAARILKALQEVPA
jgi:hypothetical protein